MVRKTRKAEKAKALTIPQLRKKFEQIDAFLKTKKDVASFRKEWRKIFGKDVSEAAAKDYLTFVEHSGSGTKTQKGGGQVLEGAPIDQMLRAGAPLPHGSFLPYVAGGFGFANADSFSAQCGKENITPTIPAGLGSNEVQSGGRRRGAHALTRRKKQKGGALPSLTTVISEMFTRPVIANSPPGAAQDAQTLWKGGDSPSGRPEINPLPFTRQPDFQTFNVGIVRGII